MSKCYELVDHWQDYRQYAERKRDCYYYSIPSVAHGFLRSEDPISASNLNHQTIRNTKAREGHYFHFVL
jgi:hypothetical protein